MAGHIFIDQVWPSVDNGRYPAKAVAGRLCVVEADLFRDGHDLLQAQIKWRREQDKEFQTAPLSLVSNDRWKGHFPTQEVGVYVFTVEAWTDRYGSWLADLKKRIQADQHVDSELLEGAALLERTAALAPTDIQKEMIRAASALKKSANDTARALELASESDLVSWMKQYSPRTDRVSFEPELKVRADRERAAFSSWYELFPWSQGATSTKSGTLRATIERLPAIRDMGFDVVYFPPIHPIGRTKRKGKNNSLIAKAGDPGSPWAIGNEHGGHTAISPDLGTLKDFDDVVKKASHLGLEIALDFAIQVSPDHPWVKEHPEWFYHRPDGSIKFAENPPKKYEDIYPINFDTEDRSALWNALRDVVEFWIGHGVKIFRVDNPHTKPIAFWQWLISDVQSRHPEIIFLAEAFTRPAVMKGLAKIGFTQSYTYFTWRNSRYELIEYLTELTQTPQKYYFRPNFFTNTPDILHAFLQFGGRPAFRLRLILAATLSPSYGIYSGYELCESEAVPGTEEYLNSEKYQYKPRDWNKPGNIIDLVKRINTIRRENPALQQLENLRFLPTNNDQLLAYAKWSEDQENVIIVVANLNPYQAHFGSTFVPPEAVGVGAGESFEVEDLLSGARYNWSENNYVRLDPHVEPAHIFRVHKR